MVGEPGAGRDREAAPDDAVGAEDPKAVIDDVHRAALALAVAGPRPKSSAIIRRTSAPLAIRWPWPRCVLVMRSVVAEDRAHADGNRLFADVQVHEPRERAALEELCTFVSNARMRTMRSYMLEQLVDAELGASTPLPIVSYCILRPLCLPRGAGSDPRRSLVHDHAAADVQRLAGCLGGRRR